MLDGRTFGVPKKREVKVDPYEGRAVLLIHPTPEKKGETYKFELTKQALIDLKLEKENADDEKLVSFSFDEDEIRIYNTTSLRGTIPKDSQYNVSMNGVFSNKIVHDYIITLLEFDNTKTHELDIIITEDEEIPCAVCTMLSVLAEGKAEEEASVESMERDTTETIVDGPGNSVIEDTDEMPVNTEF